MPKEIHDIDKIETGIRGMNATQMTEDMWIRLPQAGQPSDRSVVKYTRRSWMEAT